MPGSKIHPACESSIDEAARWLADGQLVGIPTETVYGLAADATQSSAVQRIYRAKGRPSHNPLIIHVASAAAARRWVSVDSPPWLAEQWKRATTFWPGPLTVVVPHGGQVIDAVTAGAATVAVRVPDHPVIQALLSKCPFPIAAPSANRSNYVSPTRAEHVADALGEAVAMVIDGGPCRWGLESTIIRPSPAGVELLRPGGITVEALEDVFGAVQILRSAEEEHAAGENHAAGDEAGAMHKPTEPQPMPAPGMLAKHYSPSKPLSIADPQRRLSDEAKAGVARITFAPLPAPERDAFGWYRCLSPTGDLREVAQHLFAALREADASPCRQIVIDRCQREGIGRAIMDRIERACGPEKR